MQKFLLVVTMILAMLIPLKAKAQRVTVPRSMRNADIYKGKSCTTSRTAVSMQQCERLVITGLDDDPENTSINFHFQQGQTSITYVAYKEGYQQHGVMLLVIKGVSIWNPSSDDRVQLLPTTGVCQVANEGQDLAVVCESGAVLGEWTRSTWNR